MDPALLKERERFVKRALAAPVIEKKKQPVVNKQETAVRNDSFRKKQRSVSSVPNPYDYNLSGSTSTNKFGVLAKIIAFMKARYLNLLESEEKDHLLPLTFYEIINKAEMLNVEPKIKNWLENDALKNNPRISVDEYGKFNYKPPIENVRTKKTLLKKLKYNDLKNLGGTLLNELQESLPNCDKILKSIESEIITVERPDKKKIIFYNDKTATLEIEEDFKKLWRLASVEGMDDKNIEEYLEKNGINSMQDTRPKVAPIKRKRANNRRRNVKRPKDNEHLAGILENYDENE
ncbi:hypothetical protein HCN44_001146 [Aphidius gifuensis]|uniref:Transcription initiation factor IIE subunit beta n=1 Tax=Aphidius gifuensis TaxID=684658 RepID=A0A834XJW1_APHGI|nr:transcription initiation factor IIE subunit beta-like [Aphidius gifuensis]KAF7988573.1 hypothetical protein HCN44_001146 [Aphidius gifuensis]